MTNTKFQINDQGIMSKNQMKRGFNFSLKFEIGNLKLESGFSLIELMVVLSIFGLILGLIIANYAGLRSARNLKIAQNELVSNIRKVQSYTLSSRALNGTQPVQYYLLKFDAQTPDRYVIQAMYDMTSSPKLAANIETVTLPSGILFGSSTSASVFQIDRPPIGGTADSYDTPPVVLDRCLLVANKLPFGRTIINRQDPNNTTYTGCFFNNFSNDDYSKVHNFVANNSLITASDNSILTFYLKTADNKLFKTVTLNTISGAVTFSQ